MKNIRVFLSENFQFLVVKFSVYLNRHVFVMTLKSLSKTEAGEVQSFHYFSAKIRLSFSSESSARQAILMKCQALFSYSHQKR